MARPNGRRRTGSGNKTKNKGSDSRRRKRPPPQRDRLVNIGETLDLWHDENREGARLGVAPGAAVPMTAMRPASHPPAALSTSPVPLPGTVRWPMSPAGVPRPAPWLMSQHRATTEHAHRNGSFPEQKGTWVGYACFRASHRVRI